MTEISPQEIVRKALERDELDLLLLGGPEYRCFLLLSALRSSLRYENDLGELLQVLYKSAEDHPEKGIADRLLRAMKKIVEHYEGLTPVARCILYEIVARSAVDCFGRPKAQTSLGLPLEEIASELKQSIRVFSFRLEKDKVGVGAEWPDGLLGDLRRLSRNTVRLGGPSFCD